MEKYDTRGKSSEILLKVGIDIDNLI